MKQQGMTFLEVLIVIGIFGIFMAFAIPNYAQYIAHHRRLTAETELFKLAGHLETYFAEHQTYEGADFKTLELPEKIANDHYRLEIQEISKSSFKVAAIPQLDQIKDDGKCGTLTLNSKGLKQVTGFGQLNECW